MIAWQEPLHTYDCCWVLGVDIIAAKKNYVTKDVLTYHDCMAKRDVFVPVNIYSVKVADEVILTAIGSYRSGKLVWIEE